MFKLFGGVAYYPEGGFRDFVSNFTSLEAAIEVGNLKKGPTPTSQYQYDWWHVVSNDQIVLTSSENRHKG